VNPLSAVLFWLAYAAAVVGAVALWRVIAAGYRQVQAERKNPLRALARINPGRTHEARRG
jgi:hypothetical protein